MLEGFSHVMLYVAELDRAVTWYQEKLGFQTRFVVPNAFASLDHVAAGFRLDLHPSEAERRDVGFGAIPYFRVSDLDRTVEQLRARGVKVQDPRREGSSPRFATFWDSEGNALGLHEAPPPGRRSRE
jgi:predicted enzyme related to lactoylglutathione lyase